MSVGEMQACLARLYVNEPLRKLFHIDPSMVLDSYRLTTQEADAIKGIDRAELDMFAGSLLAKRRKKVERAYPLLFSLDESEIRRYYSRFYHLYAAKPHEPWHQDAIHFGLFMEESLANAEHLPPYAAELAKYERLLYAAKVALAAASRDTADATTGHSVKLHDSGTLPRLAPDVVVADFHYDFGKIEDAVEAGQPPDLANLEPGNASLVFRPATSLSSLHLLRINPPTRAILEFCDGSRTVSAIIAATEAALHAPGNAEGIVAAIQHLLSLQVLTLDVPQVAETSAQYNAEMGASRVESI